MRGADSPAFPKQQESPVVLTRRAFLGTTAVTLGLGGLKAVFDPRGLLAVEPTDPFGPLIDDPAGVLALPEGFSYRIVSRAGERMNDGFFVPANHDGMAAFPGPDGLTLLVRNHELGHGADRGPFGIGHRLLSEIDPSCVFDPGPGGDPAVGGTTTLLYDTAAQELVGHRLSLTGTIRNCAGGPTPWGSWITCEETTVRAGGRTLRDHGYNFEVPAVWDAPPVQPVPLEAMGRFNHEAIAVDEASGIVYQTEDDGEGLIYRFIPEVPGELAKGGRLQALGVRDTRSLDTRNWDAELVRIGDPMAVTWIDLEDVEAPEGDLRYRGFEDGAARFARGEGMWAGEDGIYFTCTNGGRERKGQIFRYRPSPFEGTAREADRPGTLELFVESNDARLMENADNLCVAPWGDLIVCEDGTGDDYFFGVTPDGKIYRLGHNLTGEGEFAGSCFSPDGSTLFVNMQSQGWTLAITGPWERASRG
jgi:secreted PhoX family phosphatase